MSEKIEILIYTGRTPPLEIDVDVNSITYIDNDKFTFPKDFKLRVHCEMSDVKEPFANEQKVIEQIRIRRIELVKGIE